MNILMRRNSAKSAESVPVVDRVDGIELINPSYIAGGYIPMDKHTTVVITVDYETDHSTDITGNVDCDIWANAYNCGDWTVNVIYAENTYGCRYVTRIEITSTSNAQEFEFYLFDDKYGAQSTHYRVTISSDWDQQS